MNNAEEEIMKKVVFLVSIMLITVQYANAALAPQYQNVKDLECMVCFIKQHPKVASTLESIDVTEYTVYFDNGCRAVFGRKVIEKPENWVGPADPLEFKESDCEVNW